MFNTRIVAARRYLIMLLVVAPTPVIAAGGVLEINQACAAIGCFAGDQPGFPITITSPGSYALTSNLQLSGADGIRINSSSVHLDLRGFTITGQVTCSGSPATCVPSLETNSFGGIVALSATQGVVVRNGAVMGFSAGIFSSQRGLVEDVTVSQNSNTGLVAREGTVVRRVGALLNGRMGIEVIIGGEVVNSTANDNGQFGFATGGTPTKGGATIRNSSAYRNGGYGIYDWGRSLIEGSLISDNRGYGIWVANGGSLIIGSVITGNDGVGIHFGGSTAFEATGVTTSLSNNSILIP
jgi:hypothetical protein